MLTIEIQLFQYINPTPQYILPAPAASPASRYLPPSQSGSDQLSLPIAPAPQQQVQIKRVEVPVPYTVEKVQYRDVPVEKIQYRDVPVSFFKTISFQI